MVRIEKWGLIRKILLILPIYNSFIYRLILFDFRSYMKPSLCRLLLLCLIFCSCIKNEVNVEFSLPKDLKAVYRIVYYASDKKRGMIQQTAVDIVDGNAAIKLPTRYPSIVYLFAPSQTQPGLMFYAERGDKITISGNNSDMMQWKVGGNSINDEWTEWRIKNKDALASRSDEKINQAVAKYVKENPKSELSLILLYLAYSRKSDPEGFNSLYAGIDKKVLDNSELVNVLSNGDMLGGPASKGAVPGNLILTGEDGFADTINLKNGKTAMLVFRSGKNDSYRADQIGALKDLRKEFPDTGKYILVDIYADSDSTQWHRSIEKDSLKDVRHLWLPLGLVSNEAMNMGIDILPYYIVTDGNGKASYSGINLEKAKAAFRKQKGQ